MEPSLLFWGIALIIGLPIVTVGFEEAINFLENKGNPLLNFLTKTRRYVIPSLAILLILQQILHLENTDIILQVAKTIFCLTLLVALISLINGILTTGDREHPFQIHVPKLFFQVSRCLVVISLISYIVSEVWGFDLSRVAATLGVGSLVIALALQDTLSNLVSGFLLILEGPIKIGDWIMIGDVKGKVIDINWRSVRLLNSRKDVFVIPNGAIAKDKFINSTLENPNSKHYVYLTFSYNDRPNRVKPIIQKAVISADGVIYATVRVYNFKDYGIEYVISYIVPGGFSISKGRDAVLSRIYYAAKRYNLTIPYPVQTLYHRKKYDLAPEYSPTDIINFLASLSYFNNLNQTIFEQIASVSQIAYYGIGETVVDIEEIDEGIHIILEGCVKLTIKSFDGVEKEITRLERGDFFGELCLIPKANSIVSVEVIDDLTTLLIPRKYARELVEENRKLALLMNQFIEERNHKINQQRVRSEIVNNPEQAS